jgi:hypothetical protein
LVFGRDGYAFVVEFRADGSRRVIAHPDRQSLLRKVEKNGKERGQELVPPEQLADGRVTAFLERLPPDLNPLRMPFLALFFRERATARSMPLRFARRSSER